MPFPPSVPTDPLKAAAYGTVIMTNGGDPTGQIVYAKLVGYNGFVGPFVLTGDIAVPETQIFTLTSNGQFHFEMYGNDQIAPSGNYWRFTHAESQFSKSVPLAAATVTDVVLAAGDGPYPGGPFVPPAIFVVTTGSYANPAWITSLAATKLTGNLAIARFNGGTSADNTHFWRGDGTWAVPAGSGGSAVWGGITGTLSDQTDLQTALNARGLTASPLSQFASTTSLQLKGVISDETGSGALVFATSPSLVTPLLGTPTSGTLTNCTGLPNAGVVMATARLLGRTTSGTGSAEEISVASGIVLSGSTLSLGDITPNTVNGNVISVGTGMLTLTSGSIYVGALAFLSVSDGVSATINDTGTIITTGNLTDITGAIGAIQPSSIVTPGDVTVGNAGLGTGNCLVGSLVRVGTGGFEIQLDGDDGSISGKTTTIGAGSAITSSGPGGDLAGMAFQSGSWASPGADIGTGTPVAIKATEFRTDGNFSDVSGTQYLNMAGDPVLNIGSHNLTITSNIGFLLYLDRASGKLYFSNNIPIGPVSGGVEIGGNLSVTGTTTFGSGTAIKNIRHGVSGAMTAGAVTVTDTGCTVNTRYSFSPFTLGTVSVPKAAYASTRTAATSFVLTSADATDTSTWTWTAVEP